MLGNFRTKFYHKCNALEAYCRAPKIKGFQLKITGDIDDPNFINSNISLLGEWIDLANQIGNIKPSLYITGNTQPSLYITTIKPFNEIKKTILNISSKVDVNVHGLKHIYYSKLGISELKTDFYIQSKCSLHHRFPYLDYNLLALHYASHYFKSDSSIVSRWMYPFKINDMIEYPVCPPTDTDLRIKPVTIQTIKKYHDIINNAYKDDRAVTFLFHPNLWSVELCRFLVG